MNRRDDMSEFFMYMAKEHLLELSFWVIIWAFAFGTKRKRKIEININKDDKEQG